MSEPALSTTPEVDSPCIGVCVLNDAQVCFGCGRTRDEIGSWSSASAEQQREICALAADRMAKL